MEKLVRILRGRTRLSFVSKIDCFFIVFSALCYHCSKSLCLDHLTEHSQLLDALTRSVLEENFKILTNLSTRLQSLVISANVSKEPFVKIEQWRTEAHRQIDEIVEKKCEEINEKINEYRTVFDTMKNEQLMKINRYKQKIAELFRQTQIGNKDLSSLKKSVEKMKTNLNNFDKHAVEVLPYRSTNYSIHIRLKLNDWKPSISQTSSSSSSMLSSIIQQFEFKIKFVRLSGLVSTHYVLVSVHGTIKDLIELFIQTISFKRNYVLPTEVCQSRVRRRFNYDIQLKTIFNQINELVLYETPFELNDSLFQQRCLILCSFQDGLPWDIQFSLPILLHLPRFQCKGQDLIQVLDRTIQSYFPLFNTNNESGQYELKILSDDQQISSPIILNQWAQQVIDDHLLMADNATLIVSFIQNFQSDRLTRLDGVFKVTDKRRKSRK